MNVVILTPPRQFLINDSDLRKTNLHETSNRTAPIEQTLVACGTPYFYLVSVSFLFQSILPV